MLELLELLGFLCFIIVAFVAIYAFFNAIVNLISALFRRRRKATDRERLEMENTEYDYGHNVKYEERRDE